MIIHLGRDAVDIQDRGPAVFAVTTATLVLATVLVAARMVCRRWLVRRVGFDDYLMLVAWVLGLSLGVATCFGVTKGLGRHDRDIQEKDKAALRLCQYVFSVLYKPALMLTKTSILVFYLGLAKNTQKMLRAMSWGVLVLVNVAGTVQTLINIFQCRPIRAAWDWHMDQSSTKCIPLLTEFICAAPVNVLADLVILALPIPLLTAMRLPPRQKTILVITFALGIFVTVVDVVRIYYLQKAVDNVSTGSTSSALRGDDFAWNASLSLMWSAVEVNVGIMCACIPTLKPLILHILPSMLADPDWSQRFESPMFKTSSSWRRASTCSGPSLMPPPLAADARRERIREPPEVRARQSLRAEEESMMGVYALYGPEGEGQQRPVGVSGVADVPRVPSRPPPPTQHVPGNRRMKRIPKRSKPSDAVYFGFVELNKPKSMLKTSAAESLHYCTIVGILFLLWGFSYGLLNMLNTVIAQISSMSTAETLGLTSVYFGGGYLFGPLMVGESLLRLHDRRQHKQTVSGRDGSVGEFQTTFIAGLVLYGVGTLIFWPSAVTSAFGGFLISNFVVGSGLAVLETAANPFVILCGPVEYAETRSLVAQGVQAVGSVLSGLLADKVFFPTLHLREISSTALIDVQWTYLAVTLLCAFLALFFCYVPLPEVSESELNRFPLNLPVDPQKKLFAGRLSLRTWCILFAVAAQWLYVAVQENMSIFLHSILTSLRPADNSPEQPPGSWLSEHGWLLVARSAFALSRFLCGYLTYFSVKHPKHKFALHPRTLLALAIVLSAVCALLSIIIRPVCHPNLIWIPVVLFFFAEGPIWPLIFALGLRGQGGRTKRAAVWLTMGASAPLFWPFVQWAVIRSGCGVQTSFVVVLVLILAVLCYPIFLTFVKDARALVDGDLSRVQRSEGRPLEE